MAAATSETNAPRSGIPWAPILRYGSFLAVMLGWEFAGRTGERLLIPSFTDTVLALWRLATSGQLGTALVASNQSLVLGFLVAVVIGVPLGLLLGRFEPLDRLLSVYMDISIVVPMVALMPIVIVALGLTLTARVVIVVLFALPGLVLTVRAGVHSVDPRMVEMARAFGAHEWQIWRKILLPASLPSVVAGLRYAASRAVVGMIIVELTLIAVGLGLIIQDARGRFQADVVFAGTLVVAIEGLLIVGLARRVEMLVTPRHGPVRKARGT